MMSWAGLEELTLRQVRLSLGGSVHDPSNPVGRLLFNVLAMVAEFNADLIRMRTREGMKVARAKGRPRGRQPELTSKQEAHLAVLVATGQYTTLEVAELFGEARSAVYRALRRAGAQAGAAAHSAITTPGFLRRRGAGCPVGKSRPGSAASAVFLHLEVDEEAGGLPTLDLMLWPLLRCGDVLQHRRQRPHLSSSSWSSRVDGPRAGGAARAASRPRLVARAPGR